MQYQGNTSEESLLAADNSVTLHVRNGEESWYQNCRIIKRDGNLIAQTTQGTTTIEIPIPGDAIVNQSTSGDILVMFTR